MTQDEIIETALNSGLPSKESVHNTLWWLETFAKLLAAKEREACAMVCDVLAEDYGKAGLPMTYNGLKASSKEIRARGQA